MAIPFNRQVGFALGTGRCGTKFLYRVIDREPDVASVHERNPLNETFHRYCKWYDIPVDHEGFLQTKEYEIQEDLNKHSFSFEASAFLSLSIQELYDRFGAKFLLLIRSPEKVVNSYLKKGWYDQPTVRYNPSLVPSYQNCREFHHFLGRIIPSGEKYLYWNQMSRVGQIAWYWKALNAKVLEQFETIPETHWRIQKLEEFSYSRYLEISEFLGFKSQLNPEFYNSLTKSRPNAFTNVRSINSWTDREIAEFEAEVKPISDKLGYEYKVEFLLKNVAQKTAIAKEFFPEENIKIYTSSQTISPKELTVVIRSVGERTESACHNLLAQQIPEENIIAIRETPFSAAVHKTFKIGIERGLPWTFCIDADVLLRDDAVAKLLAVAVQAQENVFEIQAKVLCKFFGGARPAGNHLYRTSLLDKAIGCIPTNEVIRPESYTIKQMADRGFPWIQEEFVVGLHDYEQYHKDIYRKAFVQAHKHDYLVSILFDSLWSRLASEDPDYQVALWGLRAGQIFEEEVRIDTRQFPEEINALLAMRGWKEKEELSATQLSGAEIGQMIDNFDPPPEYWDFQRLVEASKYKNKKKNLIGKGTKVLGKKIQRIGEILQAWSES